MKEIYNNNVGILKYLLTLVKMLCTSKQALLQRFS